MRTSKSLPLLVSALLGSVAHSANISLPEALAESYAPIRVECPSDIQWVRPATGLDPAEAEWVHNRKRVVLDALEKYLHRLELEDFDVYEYAYRLCNSNLTHVPVLGMIVSGGGYRSGYTGTGGMRALDDRLPEAVEQRTGGLLQSLTYLGGQSGGSWPVASFSTHDFPTADKLVQEWVAANAKLGAVPENSTTGGSLTSIFGDVAAKYEAGFPVTVSDFLGRDFSYEFLPGPNGGLGLTWSSLRNQSKFLSHEMPMPMLQTTSLEANDVVYPQYLGLQVPNLNNPAYEITPFEMGSWDSSVSAFTPMEWTGTSLLNGMPVNTSSCVQGWDRISFMMGTAAAAFNFWYIEDATNGTVAPFPKRSIDTTMQGLEKRYEGQSLFPESEIQTLIEVYKSDFNLSMPEIAYSIWPNPFQVNTTNNTTSVSDSVGSLAELTFVDSTETGSSLPIAGMIQPARNVSFIIAWDDDADSIPYAWDNGTNLYNAYTIANASGLPFPIIPPVATIMNRNYSLKPTLFGCDANLTTTKSTASPIVLYMTTAPYSAYTNYTWITGNFSLTQFNEIFVNSFNQITQGNGTLDSEWTTCLGCAVIDRSLSALGMPRTRQCEKCMDKYCWDGTVDDVEPEIMDPPLMLYPNISFAEWNATSAIYSE
ncbi:FabD/lysophospholipase-like protein [Mollisia scopiformis]|uniref:Lysophospholipase n=1 Tax=Mollisia scopiformis TaxID=149040 RepID=A0A194WTQ0_MOLSC|nr:FabD/lysophospholipase-like protein [Mollisia scopiformis]KUJ11335.1 FabD/lysophospholipase-like protein [Mollisia scopiformis]